MTALYFGMLNFNAKKYAKNYIIWKYVHHLSENEQLHWQRDKHHVNAAKMNGIQYSATYDAQLLQIAVFEPVIFLCLWELLTCNA